jgi:glycosyltransferase involved in cell wall biosynthesis
MNNQQANQLKKIAIFYPCFMGGGAEAVALWMMEALQSQYKLSLFTFSGLDFEQLNLMYDTHISLNKVKVVSLVSRFLNSLTNFFISNSKDFRQLVFHSLLRKLKQDNEQYDLVISAYNAADLGKPGIQYVHWIKVIEGGKKAQKYTKISQFSLANLQQNITIANSKIVADTIKETYQIDAQIIYPPVIIKVSEIPWQKKENAFICSGRLVKAKQPHKAIAILKTVREKGYDLKLYITGGGGGADEWKYKRFLKQLVRENSTWVKLYEDLPYGEYVKLLEHCKYGIHLKEEPFGISIAEMVKAGAIPFVKSEGGQIEIVGEENQDLLFGNEMEACQKIIHMLQDSNKQQKMLESLTRQKELFSTERFMAEITQLIADFFAQDCS